MIHRADHHDISAPDRADPDDEPVDEEVSAGFKRGEHAEIGDTARADHVPLAEQESGDRKDQHHRPESVVPAAVE
jgi:hypothetical protein